jgi:integrase
MEQVQAGAVPAGVTSRTPFRGIEFRSLVDAYMAQYSGRDSSLPTRLAWWVAHFGDRLVHEITDDDVHAALELLANEPATTYVGRLPSGKPILRPKKGKRSAATINRYHVSLGALLKFAQRKRLLPKGWQNPSHQVERQPEDNARVRYLTEDERKRLLAVCKTSYWPRLYALVLMALTTGARRGELLRMTWQDIDVSGAAAFVRTSKNGEPRVLPLTPAVVTELKRFLGKPEQLVFGSERRPGKPMCIEAHWKSALKQAKISNFRFHDCRHSCASALAQQGASLLELADVLGHRTMAMVRRYSHLSIGSKRRLVDRVLGDIK